MTTIPGASQYLNSATLANQQGVSAQSANVLGVAEDLAPKCDERRPQQNEDVDQKHRRQQASNAASPKVARREGARLELANGDARNQVSRDDREDVNANEAT